jgi:hypothetical protein
MDLTALKAYLDRISGDSLSIDAEDSGLPPEFRSYLKKVPNQKIALKPAGATAVTLGESVLTVTGPSTDTWSVQGMRDVSVRLTQIAITITQPAGGAPTFTVKARGLLALAPSISAAVDVVSAADDQTPWAITLSGDAANVTASSLLRLGATGPLPFDIPGGLDVLDQALTIVRDQFKLGFFPNTTYSYQYSFSISAPGARWEPVKDIIVLDGIEFRAFLLAASYRCLLVSHLKIGGLPVEIGVGLDIVDDWTAFIQAADGQAFPGLAALAAWAFGSDASQRAITGFGGVGFDLSGLDLAIVRVAVGFNWRTPRVNFVEIVSVLTIKGLALDVVIVLPDLSISGSLKDHAPVKIKDLVGSFGLDGSAVPDRLTLSTLSLSGLLDRGYYRLAVAVDNIWTIGPFDLKQVAFTLSHFGGGFATGFVGQFDCTFDIAKVSLGLSAEYADPRTGWSFSGGTLDNTTIAVGDLISDLSSHFGVAVPDPIASLALRKVALAYETGTEKFAFTLEANLTVETTALAVIVAIDIEPEATGTDQPAAKQYKATFGGTVVIGPLTFDLIFERRDTGSKTFVATYSHDTSGIAVASLHDLVAGISAALAQAVPASLKIDLKDVKFVFTQIAGTKQFAVGLDLSAGFNLSDLPLVGDKLPPGVQLGIDNLQVLYSSMPFAAEQISAINALLPPAVVPLPGPALAQGILLAAELILGTSRVPVGLALAGETQPAPAKLASAGLAPAAPVSAMQDANHPLTATKWFSIQRQFGVFQFNRIGIGYSGGVLGIQLDAGVAFGPFALAIEGLSAGSPLDDFSPVFDFSGLGAAFAQGPVMVSGALIKLPKSELRPGVELQIDGSVSMHVAAIGLDGLGSYAKLASGDPSLFVFAQLLMPLGGPPSFFITGLMGGLGYNRTLAIPDIAEVQDFPLLLLGAPPSGPPAPKRLPTDVLDILEGRKRATDNVQPRAWIVPRAGSVWLAAGLQFTSYDLVTTRALAILKPTGGFTLALLGLSSMRLPVQAENVPAYAFVELQLRVVFEPQSGVLAASAVLSNSSYLLTPDCHLTGGFALGIWYPPSDHAGDFVLTLGGYHPAFRPPAHYPTVPQLGFNWSVSDHVSIKGTSYFALTPSCVMAGGGLDVQFHDGDLGAWLTAHADFLISWRPFFYTAKVDVGIGVSYRINLLFCHKTISISVSASLNLWGPPTGGKVDIDVVVVSFTVRFGSRDAGATSEPLDWPAFKAMLPADASVCTVSAGSELLRATEATDSASLKRWIVRPSGFSFTTRSAIPASRLEWGASSIDERAIDIRPMNRSGVSSVHRVDVRPQAGTPDALIGWTFTPRAENMPASLWGAPPARFTQTPGTPSADLMPDMPTGLTVTTPRPILGGTVGPITRELLMEEYLQPAGQAPLSQAAQSVGDYLPTASTATIGRIAAMSSGPADAARAALGEALERGGIYAGPRGALTRLASQAGHLYADVPMQQV